MAFSYKELGHLLIGPFTVGLYCESATRCVVFCCMRAGLPIVYSGYCYIKL